MLRYLLKLTNVENRLAIYVSLEQESHVIQIFKPRLFDDLKKMLGASPLTL
jgi:hypothetical protein